MGPQGKAFPCMLCFRSSLKYLDNGIWCTFPELFCRCKKPSSLQQREGVKYLKILNTKPQASWSLKIGKACDISLLPHHQPVREPCTSWSQTLWPPLLHLAFKNALLKPFWDLRAFRASSTLLLAWFCNKPFPVPNSDLSVCLAHRALGTQALH